MPQRKLIVFATPGLTTNLLLQQLRRHGEIQLLVLEKPESSRAKIKRRLRKIPFFKVFGQVMFLAIIFPLLKRRAAKRVNKIVLEAGYQSTQPQGLPTKHISSINQLNVADLLNQYQPDMIFVNGTRIISKKILDQISVPVINIHVGITPMYRGIHGGYWALYYRDAANFGVTMHYVDAGVDTGKIISQKCIQPHHSDNFASYPVLQYVAGLSLIHDYFEGGADSLSVKSESDGKQHYHPGFFQYLFRRLFSGIR